MAENLRKPEWLKFSLGPAKNTRLLRNRLATGRLNTVCQEARCPNLHDCWNRRSAAFMVLGSVCTRNCRFCAVRSGHPEPPDPQEPQRLADTVRELGIAHVVITMVTRDDLPDGGARHLAAAGRAVRNGNPKLTVEYLSSDLSGKPQSIAVLTESGPDILGHNIETVRRLTPEVRSSAGQYQRSLDFLKTARRQDGRIRIKSCLMLGLGEKPDEVTETLSDLKEAGCSLVSIGQYLQPSRNHLPVQRYWHPDEFESLRCQALRMGFDHVEAGPLVRSSYHADRQLKISY